ncbi:MAG: TraB/GumN family protein [Planctomycetes bacterium]|nr:TraB/GumN family protein [Planctomycetota bacterium]
MRSSPLGLFLRCLVAVVAILVGTRLAFAQEAKVPERPFFWRLEAPGAKQPSWLLGTFHVGDPRITTMHPVTEQALEQADAVFTELAMDGSLMAGAMREMMLPKGQTLRDVLPEELHERVGKHMQKLGGSMTAFERMQPWAVASAILIGGRTGEAFDVQIYKDAKSAGKEVGGLETVAEQMSVFAGLGADGNVAFLRQTLDLLDRYRAAGKDYLDEMIQVYAAGDGPALQKFLDEAMLEERELWGKMYAALLTERNVRMADRAAAKMRAAPERSFVFAVGALHCLGDTNVVDLLRDRGFVVSRVPAFAESVDEEIRAAEQRLEALRQQLDRLRAERGKLKKAG